MVSFSRQTFKMALMRNYEIETRYYLVLRLYFYFLSYGLCVGGENGLLPLGLPSIVTGGKWKRSSNLQLRGWLVAFHPVLMGLDSLYSLM